MSSTPELPYLTIAPEFFWFLITGFILLRLIFNFLGHRGDVRPGTRERVLRHFSAEAIDKGERYHHAGWGVSLFLMLVGQAGVLFMILSGFSPWLGRVSLGLAGGRVWLQVSVYLAILVVGSTILSAPFSYYFGYVIEHRFGFSNLDVKGWLLLQAKQFGVSFVFGVALGTGAYALLRRFPTAWVWMIPVAALAVQLIMTVLFPKLLLPLFFKVKPLEVPEIQDAVGEICDKAGVQVKAIRLIDASRYSSHTNAFFTGFGRYKSIYLFDTLLKEHDAREVAAILAHELGHWKHGHVLKGLVLSELSILAGCVGLFYVFPFVQGAEFVRVGPIHDVTSLPLLSLLSSMAGFFASPVSSSLSRHFERQANSACIALTQAADVYIRDFVKLAEENHSHLLPHPLIVFWRFSHPPVIDRIEATEKLMPNKSAA